MLLRLRDEAVLNKEIYKNYNLSNGTKKMIMDYLQPEQLHPEQKLLLKTGDATLHIAFYCIQNLS